MDVVQLSKDYREPLPGGSLLFTTKFPEISGARLIDLKRMKA